MAGQGPGSDCDRLTNHLAQKIAFPSTRQLASLSAPWAGKEPPTHLDLGVAGGCSGRGPRSFLAYVLCVSPLTIPALSLPPFSFLSLTPSVIISPHSTPQSIAPICIRTDFSVRPFQLYPTLLSPNKASWNRCLHVFFPIPAFPLLLYSLQLAFCPHSPTQTALNMLKSKSLESLHTCRLSRARCSDSPSVLKALVACLWWLCLRPFSP